uniref:non-specific serine/threonine protein kinase n=1 Tax=Daphnia magna TaxID=35525 RepID=A0A0P6IJU2_9CRUS
MENILEDYLFQMHSATCSNVAEQVNDIKEIVLKEKNESVIPVLLNRQNGLVPLLSKFRDFRKEGNTVEIIKNVLEIFGHLLEQFIEAMSSHLVVIKNSTLQYMNSKDAKLRETSYSVLSQVVIAAQQSSGEVIDELDFFLLSNKLFEKMAASAEDNASKSKMEFLMLMGRLAQYFPNTLKEKASRMINQILYEMEKEMKQHDYKDRVVGGCLEALRGFLYSFQSIVSQKSLEKIHGYLLMLISRNSTVEKKAISFTPKAVLNMLAEHAALFNKWLLRQYKMWFDSLKTYVLLDKPGIREISLNAFGKFIEESIKSLKSEADVAKKSTVLEFFVRSLCEVLESDRSSLQFRTVGLKALGECSLSVTGDNIWHIFMYLFNKTAVICIQEDTSKSLDLLPVCLESLGLVLTHCTTPLGTERTQQLQRMFVHLFKRYLDIDEGNRCGRSAAVFLVGVHAAIENQIDFSTFVRDIVIQSLIRSTRPELDSDSVKKYTSLWITLINFSGQANLPFSLEERAYVSAILDEQLVSAVSTIISRLDLSTSEENSSEDEFKAEYLPSNPADWQLFHNLVDLLEGLLKAVEPMERLQNSLIPLGEAVIGLSMKFPLIPGLYRILATLLSIIGQVLPIVQHPRYQSYMTSLINRLSQLSDDVLVSAVQAVLSSPTWLVISLSSSITGALASALKLGLTYPPLAEWPLDALEHWQTTLPFSTFDSIMEEVLPCLEGYLSDVEELAKEVTFISGKRFKRRKPNIQSTEERESWEKIRRRVVRLLGRMGPKCSRLVAQNEDHVIARSATGWQIKGHLEFGLPLSDMKPIIQLDQFLPRILHLVLHTSEIKTRMAACEFLHASVIFLTGTHSRRSEDLRLRYPLAPLYAKIFPTILNLAADSDEIIRQLFRALLIQLVHWFSRPAFYRKGSSGPRTVLGAEAALLVEVLMESACRGLDASLVRDLACECLLEFLKWTIKQSSDTTLWEDPATPEFLFQKLRASATHPSHHQRHGAAIVFNKLYRVMRESDPLTSIYTLDLLTHFVTSLSLGERDPFSSEILHQSKQALYHLTQTVNLKRNIFEHPDSRRRVAPFLTQGTLPELLDFLLNHALGSQRHCRQICLELCGILARPQSLAEVMIQFFSRQPLESHLPGNFPFSARLDVYRHLLGLGVIDTDKCDSDVDFSDQFEIFAKSVERRLDQELPTAEVPLRDTTSESFLAWLSFLTEYLTKSQNRKLIRTKTLIRTCLLPSRLGFSDASGSQQQFYACLETILPFLAPDKEVIESVLNSEFRLEYLNLAETRSLDIIRGLILIVKSVYMGAHFPCCKSSSALLKLAVENAVNNEPTSLNFSGSTGDSVSSAVRLRASSLLVELALLLGLSMEVLSNEFRNPVNIPGAIITYGQYLRSKLGHLVFPVVINQMTSVLPFIPQEGNGDSQQWALLLELLQAANQTQRFSDKRKWIVQNVLDSWKVLKKHAESYRQHFNLQLLINCLASIDIDVVGRNSDVKQWVIGCWNQRTDVTLASDLVQLLNVFIVDCSESEEKTLFASLQQFFTHNFPSKSTELEKDSDKSAYFSIFNRMIGLICVPVVFHFLVDVFALEPNHPCLEPFIQSVQNENWTESISGTSLDKVLNRIYHHAKTRSINWKTRFEAIETLYTSLLKALPSSFVERHVNELLGDIIQICEEARGGVEAFVHKIVVCALFEVAIVRVDYQNLTGHLNANFCALRCGQQPSENGRDLLKYIMQLVLNIRKATAPFNENELEIYQDMERFSFRLVLSIASVTPTLDEESMDKLIFRPMNQKFALWNAMVGTTKRYNLVAEVERHRKRFRLHLLTVSSENRPTKGYIPSQFLFGSSLSEDVYRFDFNQASLPTKFGSYDEEENLPVSSPTISDASSVLYLTLDDLNKHSCMSLLVNFLNNFYANQTLLANSEPKWMITLREALLNPNAHNNVVLFIIRLVVNLKSIFRIYANFWYKALLVALLRKIGGEPLNSLFREALDMMLEWSNEAPPSANDVEFAQAASSLLQFILRNIENKNAEILRDNIEMVRAIFLVWNKISLNIPYELVEELLSPDKSKRKLGLLILDAIVVHDFLPKNHEFNSRFKEQLVKWLTLDEKRDLTRSCAALCGSILIRETDHEFEKLVCDALQMWYNRKKVDVFVDLLYEVAIRHPAVLSTFASSNLSLLTGLYGGLKSRCLEVVARSWYYMEDPWKEIGFKTIESTLKGSNPADLCPMLALVKDLIPRVEVEEWKPLWPTLIRLSRHQNVECRSRLYEVFKKAFDLSGSHDSEFAQAVLKACSDQDEELAVKMQNFLAEKLPNGTMDRLLAYVTDFYSPGAEDYFLPYCLHFLLERTTQSHLYREPIFDQPLDDVPFQSFDLLSLSSQTVSQRPSWSNFGRGFSYGTIQPGFLRATQSSSSAAFSSTQSPANWLMAETLSTEPSSTSKAAMKKTTETVEKETFKSPLKSWKRFTTTGPPPAKPSYENRGRSANKTSSQPTIYRKYRTGELPDIQIPPSSLIAPLCAVARNDAIIAKTLFCHLLTVLRQQVREIQGDDKEFASKLNTSLQSIVENYRLRSGNFNLVAAILEYFWTNTDEISMDSGKLVHLVKGSHLQALGILVLESCFPDCPFPEQSKKPKRQEVKHQSSWFHVANLYGDIQNVDNVRAVVAHLTDCKESTKKAIESESKHNWRRAFEFYSQVFKSDTPSSAEMNFCDEYRLKCLEELGQWDEIGSLNPKKEPWNIRFRVRNALQNFQVGPAARELDNIPLPTVDPVLLADLAALALRNGNGDRAAICISKATDNFSSRYSQLSPLNFGGRRNLLEHVCIISEIQTFMEHSDIIPNASHPQTGDSLLVWDSILALRTFFAQRKKTERNLASVKSLRLKLATIALEQKNTELARKLLEGATDLREMLPFHYLIQSKVLAMESSLDSNVGASNLDRLILAKETINRAVAASTGVPKDGRWEIDLERFEASLCAQVFQLVDNIQPKELTSRHAKLVELWNVQPREIIQTGLKHAERQAQIAEMQGIKPDMAEAYFIFAKYFSEWKNVISDEEYRLGLTRSVLSSMRYGSVDGQGLFPLVILALKDDCAFTHAFETLRCDVPLFMFLPWVNQLVSYFTSSSAIPKLLIDIAKQHPVHVKIPFGLTRSSLGVEVLAQSETRLLESKLLTDLTWEMFLKSIDYLKPPEKAARQLLNSETYAKDFPIFQSKYLNLPPPTARSAHGHVHYSFSQAFTGKFQETLDQGRMKSLLNSLEFFKKKTFPGQKSLRDYSPWLANYRIDDGIVNLLELPGLKGKTLKVETFRDEIQYLQSKQLPVRLTIVVNGAVEYPILVKHGEDLRQDERIVQLLNSIDVALVRDVESRKRSLRIRTFQVIPLTTAFGILQWLPETLTLKAFLETDINFRSSLKSLKPDLERKLSANNPLHFMTATQLQLLNDYSNFADRVYPYGLRGALKKLSQSPESFFYLRNRLATSHGTQCLALWILGVGDRHLSNFLVSTKNGDIIGIDYGMAFGMATSQLPVPEVVPCRLTAQFQFLIPGLSLNGSVRDSMVHTLRVAKAESGSIIAALSVFVTEPTLNWLKEAEKKTENRFQATFTKESTNWSPTQIVERTDNLLKGFHPSVITCQDLQENKIFLTADGQKLLPQLIAVVRGNRSMLTSLETIKRKVEPHSSRRASMPQQGLSSEQQIECLIEQSTDPACLSRMYWGWEPWI